MAAKVHRPEYWRGDYNYISYVQEGKAKTEQVKQTLKI